MNLCPDSLNIGIKSSWKILDFLEESQDLQVWGVETASGSFKWVIWEIIWTSGSWNVQGHATVE